MTLLFVSTTITCVPRAERRCVHMSCSVSTSSGASVASNLIMSCYTSNKGRVRLLTTLTRHQCRHFPLGSQRICSTGSSNLKRARISSKGRLVWSLSSCALVHTQLLAPVWVTVRREKLGPPPCLLNTRGHLAGRSSCLLWNPNGDSDQSDMQ